MRRAFTLIEVNLAVMVMAVGVLGLISLYSLGYRESQQSSEDVEAAALAECNLNALVTMLSDTNIAWTAWEKIGMIPEGDDENSGWGRYFDMRETNGEAERVFGKVKSACSAAEGSGSFVRGNLQCGLVVNQEGGRCAISFRAGRRASTMIYQPIYYTEVFFQGDPSK